MPEGFFFVFVATTGGNRACWALGRRFVALRSCGFCAKLLCFSGSNEVGQAARRMVSSHVGILSPAKIPCRRNKFTRARNPTSEVFLLSLLPTHLLAPSSGPSTKLQLAKNWQSACEIKRERREGNCEGLPYPMEM